MPAIRSILICGKPTSRAQLIGPDDFRRLVGPAIDRQNLVIEMLDAQAEPGHADLLDRLELGFLERARLAFEGDFPGRVPVPVVVDPLDQALELCIAQVRRRAAAEVDEFELPAAKPAPVGIQRDLARQGVEIASISSAFLSV